MIASMGNTEALPDQASSCNIGKGAEFTEDGNSIVHDIKDNTAGNRNGTNGEVINETRTLNSPHQTNYASFSVFDPNSGSPSNGASLNDEENARLWQEVALRYQQILCKEYKMLNLPVYPLQSGGMYLYYVPVVINDESSPRNPGVDNEQHRDAYRNSKEVAEGFRIDEDRINDHLGGSRLREEQFKGTVQPVESVSRDIHRGCLRNKSEELGYDGDFHQTMRTRSGSPSPSKNTEQNWLIAGKLAHDKTKEEHNTERLEKLSEKTNEYLLGKKLNVQPNEKIIRVFKGYTIEYHPMTRDSTMVYPNTTADVLKSGDKKEEITDMKTFLTTQEEELDRLKLHHLMQDVSPRSNMKDVTQGKFTNNTLSAESTEQLKRLSKSFCADKNSHFSGGNFTCLTPSLSPHGLGRRLPRKQKLSYRIHHMSNDEPNKDVADVNRKYWRVKGIKKMSVNLKSMGKRQKLSSNTRNRKSNERVKSKLHYKGVKSLRKTRSLQNDRLNKNKKELDLKLKRRRTQLKGKIAKEPSLKGYELWIKRVGEKLKTQAGSDPSACLPDNLISQDEFLSTFRLVRKKDH